jgi:hypothetical protein
MKPQLSLGLLAAIALGGCSQTNFADMLGAGKYSSDETQVRTSNSLAMPPDLQLAPPGSQAAAAPPPAAGSQAASIPPPIDGAPSTAGAPASPGTAGTPDAYAKYGISKTNPDGTPKEKQQLWKELREAQLAEKRQRNPNYGTIFNIGELFSDD